MENKLNQRDLGSALACLIKAGPPTLPLVVGPPGAGKSAVYKAAVDEAEADLITWNPVAYEAPDFGGYPAWAKGEKWAQHVPFAHVEALIAPSRRTVVLIEDLGHAKPDVQAALMHFLWQRGINGIKVSDLVSFGATSNRTVDRGAGARAILSPVLSRFSGVIEMLVEFQPWLEWAYGRIFDDIIAFLLVHGEHFCPEPAADGSTTANPRLWHHASGHCKAGLPESALGPVLAGTVGDRAAATFVAFKALSRTLNVRAFLADPSGHPLPNESAGIVALAAALTYRASAETWRAILTLARRIGAVIPEAGALTVLGSSNKHRNWALRETVEFRDFACSKEGAKILAT